jgi:hypothetical protein
VRSDGQEVQSALFPAFDVSSQPVSPRALCSHIHLNWLTAVHLYEIGLLSFDPASVVELDPVQEAELRFLGGLVVGGCEESMLKQLLSGLVRPYAYRLDRLYYDWASRSWQLSPSAADIEAQFDAWTEQLVDAGQMPVLERLHAIVDRALADLRMLRY